MNIRGSVRGIRYTYVQHPLPWYRRLLGMRYGPEWLLVITLEDDTEYESVVSYENPDPIKVIQALKNTEATMGMNPDKTILMAATMEQIEDYLERKDRDPDDYIMVTSADQLIGMRRGAKAILLVNHCEWSVTSDLKTMALTRDMIVEEVFA